MGKRRTVTLDLKLPSDTEETPKDTAEELDLSALIAELPAVSAAISVNRQNEKNPTRWDYCAKIPVPEFDLDSIKREFGGGVYRCRVIDAKGAFVRGFNFSIDARFQPQPIVGTVQGPGAAAIEAQEWRGMFKDLVMAMIAGRGAVSQTDPLEAGLKIAALVTGAAQHSSPAKEMLDVFLKGMDLAEKRVVPTDSFGSMVHAASPLFSALADNIRAQIEQKRLRQLHPSPAAPAPPAAPTDPTMPPVATGPYAWLAQVGPYVAQLTLLAQADKDPALYADLVLDQLPEPVYEAIAESAKDPRFVEEVVNRVPEARMYSAWFRQFLTHLRDGLLEPEEPPPPTNGHREES